MTYRSKADRPRREDRLEDPAELDRPVTWGDGELEAAQVAAGESSDPHIVCHLRLRVDDLPPSQWEPLPMFLMPGGAPRAARRAPPRPGDAGGVDG